MSGKVNIEIMIDTNANSRKINGEYDRARDVAQAQESEHSHTIREFRSYMQEAQKRGHGRVEVSQRDTAQIFHEKTNLFTPELASQAGEVIYPDYVRQNLEEGHYHVEPPIHGEERYYDALEDFLRKILPDKEPKDIARLDAITPETRGLVLQGLYRDHMMSLPKAYRGGQYGEAFKEYRKVRFNAGEETAIKFLTEHPLPPEGERTAFVFVGSDKWANREMAAARKGKNDEGRFEVFVVQPAQFRGLMERVIRDIEQKQPEMRQVRQQFGALASLCNDAPQPQEVADKAAWRGRVAMDSKAAGHDAPPSQEEARAFSRFVNRLDAEERGQSARGR